MVEVTYNRIHHRVHVVGHARSGELGHDLVCAGVSTLVQTLAGNVRAWEKAGHIQNPSIQIEQGEAEISFSLPRRNSALMMAMDAVCAGFEILAALYPENVAYELRG